MWFRAILIPLCSLCAILQAQPAGDPPKGANQLRLLCVEVPKGAENLMILEKSEDTWVPRWRLKVSSNFLTDPVGFSGKSLGLAIDPSPPASNGPFNGPPAAVTGAIEGLKPFHQFELSGTSVTAVLVANPPEKLKTDPYRVILFPTDKARFGAGRILIQNFAPSDVAGMLGGKRVTVAPGKSEIVEPDADQPADMAQITLAWNDGGTPRVFCDTRWPAKTDYRRYLFILPKADGTLQPFVFPEYPPFP
jgi:hypothetical protein